MIAGEGDVFALTVIWRGLHGCAELTYWGWWTQTFMSCGGIEFLVRPILAPIVFLNHIFIWVERFRRIRIWVEVRATTLIILRVPAFMEVRIIILHMKRHYLPILLQQGRRFSVNWLSVFTTKVFIVWFSLIHKARKWVIGGRRRLGLDQIVGVVDLVSIFTLWVSRASDDSLEGLSPPNRWLFGPDDLSLWKLSLQLITARTVEIEIVAAFVDVNNDVLILLLLLLLLPGKFGGRILLILLIKNLHIHLWNENRSRLWSCYAPLGWNVFNPIQGKWLAVVRWALIYTVLLLFYLLQRYVRFRLRFHAVLEADIVDNHVCVGVPQGYISTLSIADLYWWELLMFHIYFKNL